ncbi:MAG: YdcF family protein [Clostridia bacterium]|nr:YdcF family protein [Clostridia bacterium]
MHADYVLILGGPLEGDKPSELLYERIKTAAEYLKEHPHMKAVCSGGIKGKQQRLSEAQIMKNALLELGIEEDRIILEEQAKTTLQNFKYTKQLLGDEAKVIYVTSAFHIWRSTYIMDKAGVQYIPLPAPNGAHSLGFRIREQFLKGLVKIGIII